MNVQEQFGNIDIYLFDQILKNRFDPRMKVLDAGCGGGRNLVWFLRNGYEVFGTDANPSAVEQVRFLSAQLAPLLPATNFVCSQVEQMPFDDDSFDLVISSAVLHFAESGNHFEQMFGEMWRVLKPGGTLFARLASSIGIENLVENRGDGRFGLPDGSERFLVDETLLVSLSEGCGAEWLEHLKTTNVQNLRCMTTLVWRKK